MQTKSTTQKKELSLWNVYAIATGATLSSGFFLLPGPAAAQAGSAVIGDRLTIIATRVELIRFMKDLTLMN